MGNLQLADQDHAQNPESSPASCSLTLERERDNFTNEVASCWEEGRKGDPQVHELQGSISLARRTDMANMMRENAPLGEQREDTGNFSECVFPPPVHP